MRRLRPPVLLITSARSRAQPILAQMPCHAVDAKRRASSRCLQAESVEGLLAALDRELGAAGANASPAPPDLVTTFAPCRGLPLLDALGIRLALDGVRWKGSGFGRTSWSCWCFHGLQPIPARRSWRLLEELHDASSARRTVRGSCRSRPTCRGGEAGRWVCLRSGAGTRRGSPRGAGARRALGISGRRPLHAAIRRRCGGNSARSERRRSS